MNYLTHSFIFSGGTTLHSAFKLGKFGTEYRSLSDKPLAELRENLVHLKLIIIDEISLVSADMLYTIHMRLTEIFNTPKSSLFANLNMVLVGDLLQIPPVQGVFIFKTPLNLKYKANKDILELWNSFQPMILKQNHRQGDEKVWVDALNQFREGIVTEEGEALLRERLTKESFLQEDTMHIFYTNREVKDHNENMLKSLPSKMVSIRAIEALPIGCKSTTNEKKGTIGNTQFLEVLHIKTGARVALIYNVNVIDDLVNGSYGKILGIEKRKEKIHCISVKFDDESTGQEQRLRYPVMSHKYKEENGTPIFRIEHEYNIVSRRGYGQTAKAKLLQFPLSLCYAQTAHRMQGQTVKAGTKVVLHWTKRMQDGMAYVMLGRSSRREDIYIAGELDVSQIKCNQEALAENRRLLKIFDGMEASIVEKRSKSFKISYLNVSSLRNHQEDVRRDNFLMDSDLLGLAETWLEGENTVALDGYSGYFANFGKGKGVAGYSKMNLEAPSNTFASSHCSAILLKTSKFDIIFIYLSKGYNKQSVYTLLDSWIGIQTPTIVMGDVNENALQDSNFEKFMRGKGFYQMIDSPTHDSGSLLDHIYVNDSLDQIGFLVEVDG